ncbi:MAG: SxtJ family membrane protein [Planctomycetota bacterium]|nr:SxtJ family membrane protein [Planctomycetota bacterium]
MSLIEINHNPSRTELKLFGGLWLPIALALFGFSLYRKHPESPWPWVLWGIAAVSAVVGWVSPAAIRWVYVAAMYIAFPIGWVVSHILLAMIFYGMFTLFGLVMRLRGRDVLGLTFDKSAETYWTPHAPVTDPARYFRQF